MKEDLITTFDPAYDAKRSINLVHYLKNNIEALHVQIDNLQMQLQNHYLLLEQTVAHMADSGVHNE